MNFFRPLIEQSINRSREATISILGVHDSGLRQHLMEQMSSVLGEEGCFLANPVFEHTFGWEPSGRTLADVKGGLLSHTLVDKLSRAEGYELQNPYSHQLQAWQELVQNPPKSVVITSGTGSGKTECFMVPILDDLIREYQQTNEPLVGVRALFLYPLNALINSQKERLHAWTKDFGSNIRFCLYNGNTKESASSVRQLQSETPNQILSRELLRQDPAPILMTNATMLEYMLVRQIDSPILEISKEAQSLRWIVLDEAHTYVGSQAAELSLLLRRVIHAFGKKADQIRFIATSATIADPNAYKRLQQYLADLAGVKLEQVVVIGGSRVIPDVSHHAPTNTLTLDKIQQIDHSKDVSVSRFEALKSNYLAQTIRHYIVSQGKPSELRDIIGIVSSSLQAKDLQGRQREVLDWLDLMTGTRATENSEPFLKLRIHLFQRMLHGLWACVDSECNSKSIYLKEWPFGQVYVSQRSHCECKAPVFELAFCQECTTPHLIGEDQKGFLKQEANYVRDEFSLNNESESEEDQGLDEQNGSSKTNILASNKTEHRLYLKEKMNAENSQICALRGDRLITIKRAVEATAECSHCNEPLKQGRSFLRRAYLGAPFYIANAVPTILEFCPDPDKKETNDQSPEQLAGRGRKLITFTDSRQGTARLAVRMQQEAERSRLRGLVFEILRNMQARKESEPRDVPKVSYEELIQEAENLEKKGMAGVAAYLRQKAELMKSGAPVSNVVATISWKEMIDSMVASNDVSEHILSYNRYANPELFQIDTGKITIARILLIREFARRPKNQNSLETLGLVKVGYQGLERAVSVPQFWTDTYAISEDISDISKKQLNEKDWQDFLKICLDFFVRENFCIVVDRTLQRWIGTRFSQKRLHSPLGDVIEDSRNKKWPQVRKVGQPHRLVKLLEYVTGLSCLNAADADKINLWLSAAWNDLVENLHVLQIIDGGYALNLEVLNFSLPHHAWVCPVTHRLIDTTLRGTTPYLPMHIEERIYQCQKVSLPQFTMLSPGASGESIVSQIRKRIVSNTEIDHLRKLNLWTDISDRTVEGGFYYRTAEHSAQQSQEKLSKYEEWFKQGKVNVLNCSTTMEMGVDIGGISAVVMNNVPPHPANYLQRAGRAGRRSEARAISYTLCKADPHNQRAYLNPRWPFITNIPAPNITLSSERIVQRHLNSLFLSEFLKQHTPRDAGDNTKLTVQWFFSGGDEARYITFINWLLSMPKELNQPIKALTHGTPLASQTVMTLFERSAALIKQIADCWISEYSKINEKISLITVQVAQGPVDIQNQNRAYQRALELELKRHKEEYLLRELATRAYLPGYGFPTDVINLNTYNIEQFYHDNHHRRNNNEGREDNIFMFKELPSRGMSIALREYAPGSQVVIDGRVHQSAGISLNWHKPINTNEPQKFDISWRCSTCGSTGLVEHAYSEDNELSCIDCGSIIPFDQKKLVLRPSGFVTDFYEPTSNDVNSQKFIRMEVPRVSVYGETLSLPSAACGHIRFGHDGQVFHHSSGANQQGFAVCMACGRADSMTIDNKIPHSLDVTKPHRPVGGISGSHFNKDCLGFVKGNIYLGFQTQTDVLEVYLKSPKTSQWLSDSVSGQVIALTLAAALRDVLAEKLGILSVEMGIGYRLDRDIVTGQKRSVIQLFDQVSGGAGFVLAGLENLPELLKAMAVKLLCSADCDSVCSSCLAGQDSQIERNELDRHAALLWLEENELLQHLNLPEVFSDIPHAAYCAFSPRRWINSNIQRGAGTLSILLAGDFQYWQIEHADFRNQILTWQIVDGLQVSIGIPFIERMPSEIKNSFARLAKFGVHFFEITSSLIHKSSHFALQMTNADKTYSLFSNNHQPLIPQSEWLNSLDDTIWVSSTNIPVLEYKALSTNDWELNALGAIVLEVANELNGSLQQWTTQLETLLSKECPELSKLIDTDRAVTLTYTDRYLKSPWHIMLLGRVLSLFKGSDLQQVNIQTLEPNGSDRPSTQITHDWSNGKELSAVLKEWLFDDLGVYPFIRLEQQTTALQHGRVLTIQWQSGRTTQIIFDQGMGYWRPKGFSSYDLKFDFRASAKDQINEMLKMFSRLNVVNSSQWPTFIMVN